eukprot:scaffold101_cov80-Skeletonema_menzelii.AAC.13
MIVAKQDEDRRHDKRQESEVEVCQRIKKISLLDPSSLYANEWNADRRAVGGGGEVEDDVGSEGVQSSNLAHSVAFPFDTGGVQIEAASWAFKAQIWATKRRKKDLFL